MAALEQSPNLFSAPFDDVQIAFMQDNLHGYQLLMSRYRCAMMEIETKFKVLNEDFSLQFDRNPIEGIKTRLKKPAAIFEKIERRGYPLSMESIEENLHDIAGVRVICSFPDDIYMLADCLLQQDDIVLLEWKDYIASPKPNGYRSLHLIMEIPIFLQKEKRNMKVEIQLRTIAMDFWASLEHNLYYKKGIAKDLVENLESDLLECAQTSAALDAKMQDILNRIKTMQEK